MARDHYVTQKCFEDINKNTSKLIDILNHRMTKLEQDVCWIKKIVVIQTTILSALFLTLLASVLGLAV